MATEGAYFWGADAQTQSQGGNELPISGPASAGPGDCHGGPKGTLPPAGELKTGVVCLSGPHLPPPGKVTSRSSFLGSRLLDG